MDGETSMHARTSLFANFVISEELKLKKRFKGDTRDQQPHMSCDHAATYY